MRICFNTGFLIDGFSEPVFKEETPGKFDWTEIPAIVIIRVIKAKATE